MLNYRNIDQKHTIKLVGVWITEDLTWQKNTKEICRKAYTRIPMLTKLKYVGIGREDLLTIYKLFIRSCVEYCSVVFHSGLTKHQSNMIERTQRVSLKVILASEYTDYLSALGICKISSLSKRREKSLRFQYKST